jgi:putative FmdB family regulatory protein
MPGRAKLTIGKKMPIYEYKCPHCQQKFELLRSLSQADEGATCPYCKKEAERMLSTFCSFTTDESGLTTSLGGSSCSSCNTGSCSTCGL